MNYTEAGFHTTSISGSTATFKFNGTGVWFYGAHRPSYGNYSLTVDGSTVFNGSAAASNPVFDQFLGGSSHLDMGEHTAVFTNTGGGFVDLDSLIFETQVGDEGLVCAFLCTLRIIIERILQPASYECDYRRHQFDDHLPFISGEVVRSEQLLLLERQRPVSLYHAVS